MQLDTRYVERLEKSVVDKDEVISMLRGELAHTNEEIVRRNERERETKILIRGLQNLVLRLQAGKPPTANVLDGDAVMRDREITDGSPA
jgi:intein/homing endonuclease